MFSFIEKFYLRLNNYRHRIKSLGWISTNLYLYNNISAQTVTILTFKIHHHRKNKKKN